MSSRPAPSAPTRATPRLGAVLAELGERIAPVSLAVDRTLPLGDPLGDLVPERALVRGRVIACDEVTVAMLMVRAAVADGAWLAVVDVPTFGVDAAVELGIPLERIVRVDTHAAGWVDVVGAALDGFEVVIASTPQRDAETAPRPAAVRKLRSRVQQRGAVVVALGGDLLGADLAVRVDRSVWSGLGAGHGHLRRRSLDLVATGRRLPGDRRCSVELGAAARGAVVLRRAEERRVPASIPSGGSSPDDVVVAEMRSSMERAAGASAVDGDGREDDAVTGDESMSDVGWAS